MRRFFGKITQEGESVTVIPFQNSYGATFTWEVTGANEITGTASSPVLDNNMPPKWFTADSQGSRYAVSQVNSINIIIQSFDKNGNEAIILSGNELFFQTD